MNNKKLRLFSLVSLSAATTLVLGWVCGYLIGLRLVEFWAGVGGIVGAFIGVEIAFRERCIDADRSRLLYLGPICGFLMVGGIALFNRLSDPLVAMAAIAGAGLGSLLSKYLMEFFNYDKPLSIL